jgi:hypothetical protein
MRAGFVLATVVLAAIVLAAAGCALLPGFGTGGFSQSDSGVPGCTGTSDCDAGEVCCVASLKSETTCAAAPCPVVVPLPAPVQLCHGDGDCGDAGCVEQSCTSSVASLTVRACGAIAGCVATPPASDASSD